MLLPLVICLTTGSSLSKLSNLSPLARVWVRLPVRADNAITGPKELNIVTKPIIIFPIVNISKYTSIIPVMSAKTINNDTAISVTALLRDILCFIFFVSFNNKSERWFTSCLRFSPALLITISLIPFILSRKYALNFANSERYFTPLILSLLEEIIGIMMPIVKYPISAVNARNTFETILTKITTATETSTAIQIGEMVCA